MDPSRAAVFVRLLSFRSSRRASVLAGGLLAVAPRWLSGQDAAADKAKGCKLVAKHMTGAKEVPGPGDPKGRGRAKFTITGDEICGTFRYTTSNPDTEPTGTHIHAGKRGQEGPVVVDFAPPKLDKRICVPCPSVDVCRRIKKDPQNYYANIHTETFPGGAVRAQLQAVQT